MMKVLVHDEALVRRSSHAKMLSDLGYAVWQYFDGRVHGDGAPPQIFDLVLLHYGDRLTLIDPLWNACPTLVYSSAGCPGTPGGVPGQVPLNASLAQADLTFFAELFFGGKTIEEAVEEVWQPRIPRHVIAHYLCTLTGTASAPAWRKTFDAEVEYWHARNGVALAKWDDHATTLRDFLLATNVLVASR